MATPDTIVPVPMVEVEVSSMNVTVPEGDVEPPEAAATVAMKSTLAPALTVVCGAESVVVLAAGTLGADP